jgi:subtilisin family serine protease
LFLIFHRLRDAADDFFDTKLVAFRNVVNQRNVGTPSKIAILDTGVDGTHKEIRAFMDKNVIIGKGFLSKDGVTLDPFTDKHGHGTHVASVLLQVAPDAQLFVGKIAEKEATFTPGDFTPLVQVAPDTGKKRG